MGIIKEFREFLREYKVLGLAVAFIIGAGLTSLVQSLVNDIIMPIVTPLLPSGTWWQSASITMGPFVFGVGHFLSSLINFLIIAFIVFVIVKKSRLE